MSGISTTGVPIPPSAQQAAQISQGIKNPGQHANQISSATPPANFSQGRRFFITENNGAYKLDIVDSSGGSGSTGGSTSQAAFDPSGDALEINASIAWAITTNKLDPATYVAQQEALKFSANNVITQVGASPLQTPSLAGEITGDQFDAAAILAFLKKNKASNDDSTTKADVSSIQGNQAAALLISDLITQLATYTSEENLITSDATNAATHRTNAANALTAAQNDATKLISHYTKSGAATIAADLQKLNKQQLTKLVSTLSNSVLQSISGTIDKNILAGIPLGQGHHSKTLDTNDGTVVKTPEQETQDAIVDQLESEDFHTQLTQSIIDNAQSLGLGDLSPSDLQSLASSLATVTADTIADDPQVISDAINNSSALQSDITTILQLELEGQSGRSNTPSNV